MGLINFGCRFFLWPMIVKTEVEKKRAGAVLLYTKKLKSCAKINFCLIVNNMKFDPSEEIDNENAHSIIRDIVAGGEIIFSKHTKERLQERGYSTQDVEHILLRGEITNKEFKDKTKSWAYQ